MKIGVFVYNFEHKKTQEGLFNLWIKEFAPTCIFAQDKLKLNVPYSKLRIAEKDIKYYHPSVIAERMNIPYYNVLHNSPECIELIKKYDLDVGIILGARIIKKEVIDAFKMGIINLHPAILPTNRGLDNIKWNIIYNWKQGATAHFISHEIDKGRLICQETIKLYSDDTLLDIHIRVQNKEQELLIKALEKIINGQKEFPLLGDGNYFSALDDSHEERLLLTFELYKKNNGEKNERI